MDILILALNSKYIHSSLAPWYLKAEVPEAEVCEHTVNEDLDLIVNKIVDKSPKLLALSVYIWNVKLAEKILSKVKDMLPNIVTVVGGPEVSYNPREVLDRFKTVDFVISGDGELPFKALCDFVLHGKKGELPGISYKEIISSPFINTETPKSPYTAEYFNTLNGRIAYFESSRGCPYRCAYCLSGRAECVRFFEMDYVKENLLKLANSGTKTVKFVDRTFNADKKRALEIFSFLIDGSGIAFPKDVCFHFELSADLIDDETVKMISCAPCGLFQFEIGIQSFNRLTIDVIHRKTDNDTLKHRIKELVKLGNTHIHTDLIAGLPYEDYDTFVGSFNQAYELGADMLQLGFLKILHGTELEEKALEYCLSYSKEPPYEVYETPWLSKADFEKLKVTEKAVEKIHNSGRFERTILLCLPWFNSAYEFFFECGCATHSTHNLDELTNALFAFLSTRFRDCSEKIRDALVCDRLATNSSRGLPKALYRNDERIKNIKKRLNETLKANGKRNIAILYHEQKAVYADYDNKNSPKEYNLHFIDLKEI